MTVVYQKIDSNTREKVSNNFSNLLTSTSNSRNSVYQDSGNVENMVDIEDKGYDGGKGVGFDEMNELYLYYCETFNRQHVPPIVRRQMVEYIEIDVKPEIIMIALDAAADAPNPTWRYAVAVIERCIRQGIKNKNEYFCAQKRFYGAKSGYKTQKRSDFAQRDYADGELDREIFEYSRKTLEKFATENKL